MERILVVGASGHARSVLDLVFAAGRHRVIGVIDDHRSKGSHVLGYQILGRVDEMPVIVDELQVEGVLIAIGDNYVRWTIAARIRSLLPAMRFSVAIHPSAHIGLDTRVGGGTVVHAGSVIGPSCTIGELAIVNNRASVDHDCRMEDGSSVAPGALVGGDCRIGALAAVGIGAVVIHGRRIGTNAVIGAGAVVVHDIPDAVVAYGNPARIIRNRSPGDPYLSR